MFCCAQLVDNGVAGWGWDDVCPEVGGVTSPGGASTMLGRVVDSFNIEIFDGLRVVRGLFCSGVQELICFMKKGR